MFQRKLIALLSLVAVLALMAGVSYATPARTDALTGEVGTLRVFMDDYANIFTFPTSVVRQNNLVLADLGTNSSGDVNSVSFDNQNLTLIKNFPRFGAIAFDMKQSALNSNYPSSLNHEALDMIWGKAFEKIDLALRFDLTSSKYERSTTTAGTTTSFKEEGNSFDGAFDPYPFGLIATDLLLGDATVPRAPMQLNTMGFTPSIAFHMQNDNRIEAAVTYRTYTLDRTQSDTALPANERWEDGGNASYAIYGRGIINQNDKNVWYPVAYYQKDDLSWQVTNAGNVAGTTRSADETYQNYGVGVANNMKVNDNNLLIFGLVAGQKKHEYTRGDDNTGAGPSSPLKDFTYTQTYLPIFFAGVETNATRWLTVRMSASHSLLNDETETENFGTPLTASNIKTRSADFGFSLGTGIRWNNLDIDMVLNEAFPLSGGYILSGDNATPFTRVSAAYHF